MCATCDKYVLNDKHAMCVLKSVSKTIKRTVASESNKKPRNFTRKIYEHVSKTCSWWYPKFTPSGYIWKPKSRTEIVNPNVSMPLGQASRSANVMDTMTSRRVIPSTSVSRPQLKSNPMEDKVLRNNSRGKKQEVEDHRRNVKLPKNKTSVTALAKATSSQAWLWHCRLSHLNFNTINLLSKNDIMTHFLRSKDETPEVIIDFLLLSKEDFKLKLECKVGALMYLTASRPDIMHATCYCARYQAQSTEKHLTAVKRIFRYLKDTIHMGLWYPKDTGFELTAFSYSDHAGCLDSRKSTSGGIQFLSGDKLVSWSSKKQDCTSMSSAEAEYVSLSIVQICLWIIDSGCSKHMMGNHALLTNFVEKFLGTVRFGNNDFAVIAGYGDVVIGSMTIKKVYYVEGLGHNLFSVGQFCDKGLEVTFQKSTCFVRNKDGVDLLTGLPKMKFEKDHLCSACEQGKIHQKHHKSKTAFASNKPLYLLHMDLCGPMRVQSINGKRYVLVVVDDYLRYTWVFFLHSKDEATENKTLAKFFDEVGITQQFSAARTPQQNGVVERKDSNLSQSCKNYAYICKHTIVSLPEAIATACFTQNRSIIHKRFDKTPYELINKRKLNIKFFRVFGCRCYLLNYYKDVGKLKAKGGIGVFIGYSKESAAFRIYNKQTRKIHESMNVNFDEISEMASKQFSLEPGLSKLNETGKSSNPSVSQVFVTSRKDLEDLFHNFYDEYFDSSKIMNSSTTNVETSIIEEVFHEVSESFQGEPFSSSLNDDVQLSP
nr:hypothetical protein [Tanacetum cinerariifolium]